MRWLGDMGDFWVFGYGSLIWRPGFAHVETSRARLYGFRRSLCVYSWVHRGTEQRPGLVLGLDHGGSCVGLAFRVPGELRDEVVAYLRERELVTNVYLERLLPVRLASRRNRRGALLRRRPRPPAICRQPVGATRRRMWLPAASASPAATRNISPARVEHLKALGIRDHWLESVAERVPQPERTAAIRQNSTARRLNIAALSR